MRYYRRGNECSDVSKGDLSVEVDIASSSIVTYLGVIVFNVSGSPRSTVNGWQVWRTGSGETLADLREQFLALAQSRCAETDG